MLNEYPPDFKRLWMAAAISQIGSAVGAVAFPLILLNTLGLEARSVTILAVVSSLSVLAAAIPMGAFIEVRPKRPAMIFADLARSATVAGVPLLSVLGSIGLPYLCFVAAVNGAMNIGFMTASQTYLRTLVGTDGFAGANSKLLSTQWLSLTVGPSVAGGMLIFISPPWLCAVDAASFVVSALIVAGIRVPELDATLNERGVRTQAKLITEGHRFVLNHRVLRKLLLTWAAFAGLSAAFSPVSQVFYVRELGFSSSQYGLLMGIPSLGGFIGSWYTGRLVARLGGWRTMRLASWSRGLFYVAIACLVPGSGSLIAAIAIFSALLAATSIANSSMTGIRVSLTPESYNARVTAIWAFSGTAAGPTLTAATLPFMDIFGARAVLAGICVGVALTPFLLPPEGAVGCDGTPQQPAN